MCISDLEVNIPQELIGAKVADLTDVDDNWNWSMLEQWLPASVLQKIQAITTPDLANGEDTLNWPGDRHGIFSVAAAYHRLCNFTDAAPVVDWKRIWKLKLLERVRCFMWTFCHNRLLTNYRKSKMGIGSPMCDVCANTIEDELHVLRDCPKAMALWISVVHNGARNDFFLGGSVALD